MSGALRIRILSECVIAILAAALAILTLFFRGWIEALTGVDPDAGSGALEWAIVAGLTFVAIASAVAARADLRRAAAT